ncbi:MAG: hypothetical protein J0L53_15790 [Spirochaetes bacterium]|nr:hypothetical protein [Spirochaetota bacterium]
MRIPVSRNQALSAILLTFTVFFSPLWAAQQTITGSGATLVYDDNSCGGASFATQCQSAMNTAFNKTIGQFQLPNLQDYMKYMSSAQAVSTKGQGVDYTTNPSVFVVGVSAGAGLDTGNSSLSDVVKSFSKGGSLPPGGYGLQFSIMAGLNMSVFKFKSPILGVIDLNRLTVYGHAAAFDFSSLIKQDGLTVKSSQFGFHTKYKILEPRSAPAGLFNWGGLDFITGLTIASNNVTYKRSFDEIVSGSRTLSDPEIRLTPAGTVSLSNNAVAVPFEIATSVRLLYFLSLFGGAGIDLNFGKSSMDVSLGSVSVAANTGSGNTAAGTLTAGASESSNGRFGALRFFAGAAINLVPMKNTNVVSLITQANISTGGGYGLMVGVRAGW